MIKTRSNEVAANVYATAPRHPLKADIDALSERFWLGWYGQNWEIETADAARLEEFIDAYDASMQAERRFALMLLILASLDARVRLDPESSIDSRTSLLLRDDFGVHFHTVIYWARLDVTENLGEFAFAITPWIRGIFEECTNGLLKAAYLGDVQRLKSELRAAPPPEVLDSALFAAAESEHASPEIIEILLQAGARVDARAHDRGTPLHEAASNKPAGVSKLLIAAGADVNATDKFGSTPLALSVMNNQTEVVRDLLAAGANPRLRDTYGYDALLLAVEHQRVESVQLLLGANVDLAARNGRGETAAEVAARQKNATIAALLLAKVRD